tara:strand:- start:200 stop:502 length:303 start_codon:yes stop_codon:yes gene_type:complete
MNLLRRFFGQAKKCMIHEIQEKTMILRQYKQKKPPKMESLSSVLVGPNIHPDKIDKYNLASICIETQHNWTKIVKVFRFSLFGQAYLDNPLLSYFRLVKV